VGRAEVARPCRDDLAVLAAERRPRRAAAATVSGPRQSPWDACGSGVSLSDDASCLAVIPSKPRARRHAHSTSHLEVPAEKGWSLQGVQRHQASRVVPRPPQRL